MTQESAAVLLAAGEAGMAAIARHEFVEVIAEAKSFHVPAAPPDCDRLVRWRGELIPVVDLRCLTEGAATAASPDRHLALVVTYQPKAGESLRYACLWLRDYPRAITVNDNQSCDLPPGRERWLEISRCSFLHDGDVVPILDLPRIFSGSLSLRSKPA